MENAVNTTHIRRHDFAATIMIGSFPNVMT